MTRRTGQRRRQRVAELFTAVCTTCDWSASGRTWRPVKRALAAHKAKQHADLVAAKVSA